MPSPRDTGLCRVCMRRKTLNKHDRIARHTHLGYTCYGTDRGPVEGSIQYNHPEYEPIEPTLPERIAYMTTIIETRRPKTDEDNERAHRTLEHFRQRQHNAG